MVCSRRRQGCGAANEIPVSEAARTVLAVAIRGHCAFFCVDAVVERTEPRVLCGSNCGGNLFVWRGLRCHRLGDGSFVAVGTRQRIDSGSRRSITPAFASFHTDARRQLRCSWYKLAGDSKCRSRCQRQGDNDLSRRSVAAIRPGILASHTRRPGTCATDSLFGINSACCGHLCAAPRLPEFRRLPGTWCYPDRTGAFRIVDITVGGLCRLRLPDERGNARCRALAQHAWR